MGTCFGRYGSHAWVSHHQQFDIIIFTASGLIAVVTYSMAYHMAFRMSSDNGC